MLTEQVLRQEFREKELQKRFDELRYEADRLLEMDRREKASVTAQPVRYDQPAAE